MTEPNIQELAEELYLTAQALIARWGNQIRTTAGEVESAKEGRTVYIDPPGRLSKTVRIEYDGERYWMRGGPVAAMEASSILESITLYLASADFVANLDGSISRLKKIQKALS